MFIRIHVYVPCVCLVPEGVGFSRTGFADGLCYHLETGNQKPSPLQKQKDTEAFFTFNFNFKVCMFVYVRE